MDPRMQPAEIKLVSHSNVVFLWPAWVVGYAVALASYLQGEAISVVPNRVDYIHPSNNPGLLFIGTLLVLMVLTHARLRGVYSVLTLVTVALIGVLFAWLGWWDDIFEVLPTISARANAGFYLVFSTGLLIVWLLAFLVFDRTIYWSVRPGQIVEHRLVGGAEHSYDTQGLVFERRDQDFFRHVVLGLGAGDLVLKTGGARPEEIHVPNVLFIDWKLRTIQELIAIKPEQVAPPIAASTVT